MKVETPASPDPIVVIAMQCESVLTNSAISQFDGNDGNVLKTVGHFESTREMNIVLIYIIYIYI